MSSFATSIVNPSDFKNLISQYFKPPTPENRRHDGAVIPVTSNVEDIDEENNDGKDKDDGKEENNTIQTEDNALLPEVIAMHVNVQVGPFRILLRWRMVSVMMEKWLNKQLTQLHMMMEAMETAHHCVFMNL